MGLIRRVKQAASGARMVYSGSKEVCHGSGQIVSGVRKVKRALTP